MSDDFEKVKREVQIKQVIEYFDANADIGRTHVNPATCCGHNDCMSLVGDGGFLCYSCNAKGSVIDLVMAREQISDKAEALKFLADNFNVEISAPSVSGSVKEKKTPEENGLNKILRAAMTHYKGVRVNGAAGKAADYFLKERGHFDETMEAMEMGWTDGGLGKALRKKGFTTADLVNHGLVVDKDSDSKPLKQPRDFFWKKGMAVFPVLDHAGKVISLTVKDPEKKFMAQQMKGIKKDWFINHAALGKHSEIVIVEGQHDMASLIDVGFKNVVGTCGGPGKDQIRKVKNHCNDKKVILWFDKDPDKDPMKNQGGPAHTRMIYNNLKDSGVEVRIIMHPGDAKDPDDFIQKLIKEKGKVEAKKVVRELMAKAVTPLEWEIEQIALIKDAKDSIIVLKDRKLPQWVNSLDSYAEREIYAGIMAKAIPLSTKGMEDILEQSGSEDLYKTLGTKYGDYKNAKARRVALDIYEWFLNNSGRFFKTAEGKASLFYHGKIYDIGDNNDFNALMLRLTHLGKCESPGTQVWYYLKTFCTDKGELVDMTSWTHVDMKTNTAYYNLSLPFHKIMKITAGEEPATIDNGTNEESVLLSTSPQLREFSYNPNTSEAEGFSALKRLLMDPMPCAPSQRYFLACWVLSAFMISYQSDRGLVQVIGSTQVGKSKVAERWSQLIYGEAFIGRGTGAAARRIATRNPIIFLDNIENKNLNQGVVDFLLFLANSAQTPKASSQNDYDVIYQRLESMGLITSIEPFPGKLSELINRTFSIVCEKEYRMKGGYVHSDCMAEIAKERSNMISAILKMLSSDVLTNLQERAFWMKEIHTHFPGHNKERNNEHLTTMMLILEALLKYIPASKNPPRQDAAIILKKWIEYQEEQSTQTAITSNTLLTILDGLQKEICFSMKKLDGRLEFGEHRYFKKERGLYHLDIAVQMYEDDQYMETFYLTEPYEYEGDDEDLFMEKVRNFEMIVSSKDLDVLFSRYHKGLHKPNPFADGPSQLGARIGNDKDLIKKGGWSLLQGKNKKSPYFMKNNDNFWRFSKVIKALS